ncbi:hypothetical protein Pmani_001916 [Petrolisthes manimaculis]|uniref:DDE Tnp4 domain-containing protein n=2 Tax=Petrolisthes manimaculis TaxID=1843537 RepID=A0AAE1QC38_9EUCA|nr:hypothetical protein Pmani_006900 [Petrolisthes manimaculis]KAK4323816.1 hypothetical protein Pmani_005517 [Petrolisthes manimaculis]KAK4323819.1 hypothetical protein Pmani_005520 [Petrolisthes manimaculis]KAK4327612.1 hypothetical protein Pmani_001916 [Petrolisthes manimaculis]
MDQMAVMDTLRDCVTLLQLVKQARDLQSQKKRLWVRPWLKRRSDKSVYNNLVQELSLEDHDSFKFFHRVNQDQFLELLSLVEPLISKQDTRMRKAVTSHERLSVTLRHLATGESKQSLGYAYWISPNLLSRIIPEVCEALYQMLHTSHLKLPQTEDEWRRVQADYNNEWQFPNCMGALDGKRVLIGKPAKSGSIYYDYKSNFSVIMLALVDAKYKFLYADVGGAGRASDGGVWDKCTLNRAVQGNVIGIPPPSTLPYSNIVCPSVLVGDDAFPLRMNLMKPYPGKNLTPERMNFNYRLSRARRTSENAFGILSAKFRIFKQPIITSPKNISKIILATVVLHNYLRSKTPDEYRIEEQRGQQHQTGNAGQPEDAGAMRGLARIPRNADNDAKAVREQFMAYFNNEGRVDWQERMAPLH